MKKITFILIFVLLGFYSFGQTTVTIGTGTLSASGINGSPIYRSSAASTINFSQSVELLTPADLSAVGITSGSTISKIAYKKLNAFTLTAGRTAAMKIYMKNSAATAFGTTTNFATYTTGSTLCYDNPNYSNANLPAAAGWVEFNFTTPFIYTGGAIEVGLDWGINTGTGNPSDGAFAWEYTTVSANQSVGTSNTATITGNLTTVNTRIYNTQLTYTNSPCTGTPAPGNTIMTTSGCYGSSATLSLQNPTAGSGVTYQWYKDAVAISGATNAIYVISSVITTGTYYCEVTCGGNMTPSSSLVVNPSILTPPLLEPFATFLPSCWTNMFGGDLATGPTASTGSGWVADGFANSGTTGAIRNEIWTTGANDWVVSPVINIPATGYELKFEAAATQFGTVNAPTNPWEADDYIEVLVAAGGSTTNWTSVYTYNDANMPSNAGAPNIIDLDAFAGQNVRFAFHAVEGSTNGSADIDFSIDNFQVRLTPACSEPIGIVTGNVTSSTVDVSWSAPVIAPSVGYEYFVSTSNTVPVTAGTATANTYATPTGLLSNTTYYIFVRSDCGGLGFSSWTGPVSFTTTCAPVPAPFSENFTTFLPSVCWFNRTGGTLATGPTTLTGSGWVADGLGNVGTTGAIKNEIWTTGANDWFISPEITIPATGYELKFDAAATQFGTTNLPTTAWEADDYIEVVITTTGLTNWTSVFTYNDLTQPGNTATPNIIDLDAYAGQTVRIAFHVVEGSTNGAADIDFSIDNFQVRLTPSCSEPTGIVTANITSSTVDMSWNAPAAAPSVGYEYVVSTSNTVPVTAGTATTNTYATPTGLLSNTTYYIFVRSDCGVDGFSAWTGPVSFTTTCAPVPAPFSENFTTFLPSVCWFNRTGGTLATGPTTLTGSGWVADGLGNVGTTGAIKNEIWITGANDWFISPEITIPAIGYELKFDAAATQFGTTNLPSTAWEADDYIEVVVTSTGLTNWTSVFTYNNTNQPGNTATPNIIDLDAYAGQNIRIAFHAVEGSTNGAADIDFSIDNFQVRLTPSCVEPLNLVSSGVSATTANISWDPTSPAPTTGYEYFVSTSNTVPVTAGTATTNTYAVLSSLLPTTTYYIFVRSDCSAGDFSPWTGPISFTTACAPITTLPWNEGFEGLATVGTTSFPPCWFKQNGDWASQNTNGTYSTSHSGTNYIRDSYSATNEYIWTPGFDLVAGTSYDFSSWVQGDNGTGWVVDYFVNTSQTSTGATQVGASYNVPGAGTPYAYQPYALVTRSFVPPTTGIYFFAVRVNQPSGAPWYVSFDDFKLELSPTIPPACATNLVATPNACGNFSNNLTWDLTPSSSGYYVTIGTTSGGTDIANAVNVGSNSYSFSGTIGTTYYWKVVPYNASGSATGCTEQSFTTAASGCYCASVPTSNDGLGITTAVVGATTNPIADVTYVNLTSAAEIINPGANANVQLTFSTGFTYDINIWIDFNNDYDFNDAGELVKTGIACTATTPNTVDASFTMPLTAPSGSHRMRIGSADTGQVPPNPCYGGTYGVTLDFTVDTTLGSASFDKSNFVAYPNPVKDILNLSYNSTISNVRVINLLGQEVLNKKTNANDVQVNMSALNAGAYIVNITVEDTVHTIKVIKE